MASPPPPLLEVRSLTTTFGGEAGAVTAVDDVSFDVAAGQRFALVGESGSGKTATALSLLRLIDPPGSVSAERMALDGRDLLSLPLRELRQVRGREIALVLQDPLSSLSPTFTVGEQIAETVRLHGLAGRRAARARAVELLGSVGVPDPARRLSWYPHQLSGGLRQRVAIAIALACEPKLLIADEPTTALDVTVQAQVMELLMELSVERHMAVLLITHDLGVVAEFADAVAVMYSGRIVERGTTEELFRTPRHPYTRALLDAQPSASEAHGGTLRAIPGAPPTLRRRPSGCAFHPRCALRADRALCAEQDPALRHLTSDDHPSACHFAEELTESEKA